MLKKFCDNSMIFCFCRNKVSLVFNFIRQKYKLKRMRIFFLFFLSLILIYSANWPMYRGNHYLTGNNDEIVPESNYLNWEFKADSFIFYPVSYNHIVFIGGLDKNLYALNEFTGSVIWKLRLQSSVIKSVVTYKNYVAVTSGSFIYVIEIDKGRILWSRKEGISVQLSTPIIINGIIFYGSRKFFYARFINNGHLIWKNTDVQIYGGTPIYWNKKIYFISKNFWRKKSIVMCLNAVTGKLIWTQDIPSYSNIFTPVIYNGKVYISAFDTLYCLDGATGRFIWSKRFNSFIGSSTVFANNKIYLSLMNGKIHSVKPATGDNIDSLTNYNETGANFIIVGETIFIADDKGIVHSVNMSSKVEKWRFNSNITNRIGTMSVNNGRLYFAIANHLFSIAKGILPPMLIASKNKNLDKNIIVKFKNKKNVFGTIDVIQDNNIKSYEIQNNKVKISVNPNKDFTITTKAKDYFAKSEQIKKNKIPKEINMKLDSIKQNKSYNFNNIRFAYNSAELKSGSIPVLNSILKTLKDNPQMVIEIRGHTDNIGSAEYNLKLSQKRAEKVKEYFVKNGITDIRLKTRGYGVSKPVASNDTEAGRAKNRRTEFYIIKK